jgi:hypothetical protein
MRRDLFDIAVILVALWLVYRERARTRVSVNPIEHDTIVMQLHLSRVFVLRIWLGRGLLKLTMWVIGGRAEVLPQE